ncbi:eukaryotic translation initiation factor 3 subunit D isoform X1 [Lepeophtheirus salmonis]|uniref:eukaryotic translation initiation factor 3 subunit D isoform X1 n=1 Tax=Lepeophtheirus salmonis TaxID=72036 RepID=UPI001AE293C5|nr:eukaryotic translation initiation factor 3 subunit D-like [Lepeophtheirus salmonis]
MAEKFEISKVQYNPTGWGPSSIPPQFKDMPYQPFSKSDRLGKISDWTGNTYSDRRHVNKYNSQFGAGGTTYAYYHEEDENSFQLVDTSKMTRPLYGRGRYFRGGRGMGNNFRGGPHMRWPNAKNTAGVQVLSKAQMNKERERIRQVRKWQRGRQNYNKPVQIKQREASVTVKGDWTVIEEIEKTQLSKLSLPNIAEPEDLLRCGSLEYYNKSYDRVNIKSERPLKRINRVFHTVTTTDDPIIRKLSKSHPEANVFATDIILATLMCAHRSVYSWDIVVQKIGDKIFLDKRDNTEFGLLTVSETAAEPPQDEGSSLNSPQNLALEATFINHNFSQQVLKTDSEVYKFEEKNPFWSPDEEGEVASVGYRYRMWTLGNNIRLIARCEHDAVCSGPNNEIQFMNIKALNEWDSKYSGNVDWRQKLDTQRGAVLANELKHNACKLAKWTVQALLVGSDALKFGYISRYNVKDSSRHVILGTQHFKPAEFANQINLSLDNAWGIVRCIVDLVMAQKDGKYLIVKDPNKHVIRLYDIPDNTFESEEDTDDSDEDGDGLEIPLKA